MILEFRNIHKSFGDKDVLKGVNFTARSGLANAYLGTNGSGKTTSFRILLDIFKADKGEILLDGKSFDRSKVKIGYLPEERGMYDGVGLVDQLVYFGQLKGMSKSEAKKEAKRWLDFFELEDNKKQLKTLSKGNAQKIQIIQCVIDDPDILILDEPFSGLDPVNTGKLKEIINDFIARDKLVIFSSHQMPVVESFCEYINILNDGRIELAGNLENIKKEYSHGKMLLGISELSTSQLLEELKETKLNIEYSVDRGLLVLDFKIQTAKKELLNYLEDRNYNIEEFKLYKPTLEEIFVEKVGENNA
ncbi:MULTISPECIES: ABC transporter ATP-binding protein [unclassified Gemella]|uniref:ABC transporter ATP-binding protein n=1 Tax=unclassified Gemella TaxID=2624949 RepID=UPI001073E64A|nr:MULTISPECIES: ATP-binding cassette domain-containing protein [unclassified Gemella]MBF0710342.1 ATP-binding cassette domain-containing protein [Gemella sp. GL1.1]MBF0747019.1 ATP-binding cassette domain-containing protein [Gemella sp. 19428wG2_WT2a]NYS27686.1 ATP-binding cassette domain-containing protein [Gemella sp. GL1]TFU58835.1 ATP-binding cassette domain-containing protein [Gemella sp. WT2a]